ncbi:MAG TPA: hypothetical protein VK979_01535 [Guyparkeria sp.]|nr:hypothetical protein [Guyparkeria sp.]
MLTLPFWLAAAALALALIAVLVSLSLYRGLKQAQLSRERWFQTQLEQLEREHRGLESALAGFGRHIDQLDEQGRDLRKRLSQVATPVDDVAAGGGHRERVTSSGESPKG